MRKKGKGWRFSAQHRKNEQLGWKEGDEEENERVDGGSREENEPGKRFRVTSERDTGFEED